MAYRRRRYGRRFRRYRIRRNNAYRRRYGVRPTAFRPRRRTTMFRRRVAHAMSRFLPETKHHTPNDPTWTAAAATGSAPYVFDLTDVLDGAAAGDAEHPLGTRCFVSRVQLLMRLAGDQKTATRVRIVGFVWQGGTLGVPTVDDLFMDGLANNNGMHLLRYRGRRNQDQGATTALSFQGSAYRVCFDRTYSLGVTGNTVDSGLATLAIGGDNSSYFRELNIKIPVFQKFERSTPDLNFVQRVYFMVLVGGSHVSVNRSSNPALNVAFNHSHRVFWNGLPQGSLF